MSSMNPREPACPLTIGVASAPMTAMITKVPLLIAPGGGSAGLSAHTEPLTHGCKQFAS